MLHMIGILGCGTMGAGITEVVIRSGYVAIVKEQDQPRLDQGIKAIQKGLKHSFEKGIISKETKEDASNRLSGTLSMDDLKDCDLIIEAVSEEMQVKKDLFKDLDQICKREAIFASNTSSLSITEIAASTSRSEYFLGLHFFNPVPVMPLVEVIRTLVTHSKVLQAVLSFVESLGKHPIIAKDTPGFVVNFLLTPYLMDAISALAAGLASIQDIDNGMKLGCGYPMGPLMLADFIGLDVLYMAGKVMFEEYKDKRYAPPSLLIQMVRMGHIGKKVGRGFYDWSNPKNPIPQTFVF